MAAQEDYDVCAQMNLLISCFFSISVLDKWILPPTLKTNLDRLKSLIPFSCFRRHPYIYT